MAPENLAQDDANSPELPRKWIFWPSRRVAIVGTVVILFSAVIAAFFSGSYPDLDDGRLTALLADVQSNFVEIDGLRVHYRDTGFGPPILLIHGNASSLHTWDAWAKLLESHRRVIRLDLPGFGLTGPDPKKRYDFDSLAQFIDNFRDALGFDHFALAGSSHGGRLAWTYAARFPEHVKKLVLVDPAGFPLSPLRSVLYHLRGRPVISFLSTIFTPRIAVDWALRATYGDQTKITSELIDHYHALSIAPGVRSAVMDMTTVYDRDDTARLKNIKMPTLVMWGRHDITLPVSDAERFAATIPGARLKIFENAGHTSMEEIPQESAQELELFLDQ